MKNYVYCVKAEGKLIPAILYDPYRGFTVVAGYNLVRLQSFVNSTPLPKDGLYIEASKRFVDELTYKLEELSRTGFIAGNIIDLEKLLDQEMLSNDISIGQENASEFLEMAAYNCPDEDEYDEDDYDEDDYDDYYEDDCEDCDDCDECEHCCEEHLHTLESGIPCIGIKVESKKQDDLIVEEIRKAVEEQLKDFFR